MSMNKKETHYWQKVLETETKLPVTSDMSLTHLTSLKHLHTMINGLPQGSGEIKQEYF